MRRPTLYTGGSGTRKGSGKPRKGLRKAGPQTARARPALLLWFLLAVAHGVAIADNGGSFAVAGSGLVKIDIYDQSYNVNAEGNAEYLTELAAYVDLRMREVAEAARTVDSLKVAVLAALNIADELFAMRERQKQIEGPLRERVEKCVGLVESALEHTH